MRDGRMTIVPWALCLVLFFAAGAVRAAHEPAQIAGPEACGECHKAEVNVWRQTKHSTSFQTMHRGEEAKKISAAMGITRIKGDSLCMTCHFTQAVQEGSVKPIAGTSCESCHGAARDWVKTHNDYGGPNVKKDQETPDHKAQRLAQTEKAGMLRPSDLYRVAENCFQCHTVPHEKLVNVGGHRAGSEFELVSWSQGENRHNYSASGGKTNDERPPGRRRMLYIVGRMLDLEYGLRGAAKATEAKPYAAAMSKRVQSAFEKVQEIQGLISSPEIKEMLDAVLAAMPRKADGTLGIGISKEAPYSGAADKVKAAARRFVKAQDGSSLAAVDRLIPAPDKYKGTPLP